MISELAADWRLGQESSGGSACTAEYRAGGIATRSLLKDGQSHEAVRGPDEKCSEGRR